MKKCLSIIKKNTGAFSPFRSSERLFLVTRMALDEDPEKYFRDVKALYDKYEKPEGLDTFKAVVLMGILRLNHKLKDILPIPLARTIPLIINATWYILAAIESARVYILPLGCIEHYYIHSDVNYMPITAKDRLFHNEVEVMVCESKENLKKDYADLIEILKKACAK